MATAAKICLTFSARSPYNSFAMNRMKKFFRAFSAFEICLWGISSALVIGSALLSRAGALNAVAAEIGVTSLVLIAKGYPVGQFLTALFCVLYAVISYTVRYYGEMITYLAMTLPCAVVTMVQWLRHPFQKGEPEVEVKKMTAPVFLVLSIVDIIVTVLFYFILRALDTPNLWISTLSVATSFLAVGMMFLRSPYYALAYAANDIVLIALWVIASFRDASYLPTVVNFVAFLANDVYGFLSWRRMQRRQAQTKKSQ